MKKKIGIICTHLSKGGAERAAGYLSLYLKDDYEIFLLLFDSTTITYNYSGQLVDLGLKDINEKFKGKGKLLFKLSYPLRMLQLLKNINRIKEELKLDTSISFLEIPNILNLLSKKHDRIILSVRSTRSLQNETFIQKLENTIIKLLYNKADKTVALSHGVKDDLIKSFNIKPEKIEVINNFFDYQTIKEKCKEPVDPELEEIFKKYEVIINVGRLVPAKDQERLLNEFYEVNKIRKSTFLLILGSGPEEEKLKNIIAKLDLQKYVRMIPYTDNPFKYMYRSKLFVFTSKREGYGNVLLEAMACGVPIISTDCFSGPREILADINNYDYEIFDQYVGKRGILIPLLSLNKSKVKTNYIEKAVLQLLNDVNLQSEFKKNGDEYIRSFPINSIKKKWEDIL